MICPLPHDKRLLTAGDSGAFPEDEIAAALAEMQPETVIADPLYRFILPKAAKLIGLPHTAFSGRCYDKIIPDLTGNRFDAWYKEML